MGAELYLADVGTDAHDEANSCFSQFYELAKKWRQKVPANLQGVLFQTTIIFIFISVKIPVTPCSLAETYQPFGKSSSSIRV
jgi:hypothetical protein